MRNLLILCGLGVAGVACGVTHLDAGSTGTDGGTPDAVDTKGVLWPTPPTNDIQQECSRPAPGFAAGVWKGRFDSYVPPSGANLVIDVKGAFHTENGQDELCGTVTFGTGDPVPLPTDPSAAPPDAPQTLPLLITAKPGFPYQFSSYFPQPDAGAPLAGLTVAERRLRFSISLEQNYKAWCNMQPSYLESLPVDLQKVLDDPTIQLVDAVTGKYGCIPPRTFAPAPGAQACEGKLSGLTVRAITCEQAEYCFTGLCTCGPNLGLSGVQGNSGCTANGFPARFDVTVSDDGTTMSGSYVVPDRVETMRFTRSIDGGL